MRALLQNMFPRSKKEDKTKLEHKLYLSRESPELSFDLSECSIHNVPAGTYSICRVLRKESLNLQQNHLSSLSGGGSLSDLSNLVVLDLSNNSFKVLPNDIDCLTNIQELYIRHNQLKQMPLTICNLTKLQILDVASNQLRTLPTDIDKLQSLVQLDIRDNSNLKMLPPHTWKLRKLSKLLIDADHFVYPNKDVISSGVRAIKQFLCEDSGLLYKETGSDEDVSDGAFIHAKTKSVENVLQLNQMRRSSDIQSDYLLWQQQETELANSLRPNKTKLLNDIMDYQNKFEVDLAKLQADRDKNRQKLLDEIEEEEQKTEMAINNLLSMNSTNFKNVLIEEQQKEAERFSIISQQAVVNKDAILSAMEDDLMQETEMVMRNYRDRYDSVQHQIEKNVDSDKAIENALVSYSTDRDALMLELVNDTNLQRAAVGILLERSDLQTWTLLQQVRLVESELAVITKLELERQRIKADTHIADLSEKRVNLSQLLINLLEEKDKRRNELFLQLTEIEENCQSIEDIWLKKYQHLLEMVPSNLAKTQNNMNPRFVEALLLQGVIQCLPLLSHLPQHEEELLKVTDHELVQGGIQRPADRENILKAIESHCIRRSLPSAPPPEDGASAPIEECDQSIGQSECVICFDARCDMVILPCGHLCSCEKCIQSLTACPLCRSTIERTVRVFH